MTSTPFAPAKPRSTTAVPQRSAGGDNEVERDGNGRPRILTDCQGCNATGKVPSEKRPGKFNQCPRCKGEGRRKVSYTRVTTFIDALEDKETLMTWKARMVLIGAAMDTGFLKDIVGLDPTEKNVRDMLNRRAEAAAELAGASAKAKKGTLLHALTEIHDAGEELPLDVEPEDWLDIQAYAEIMQPFDVVRMEKLIVNDHYRVAGTPDRNLTPKPGVTLRAPDGQVFRHGDVLVGDTKSGRIDLGALKIAMQLALYARSPLYDPQDGSRSPVEGLSERWGIVMHLPAGTASASLHWADLTMGWQAVELAFQVREARRLGRNALIPFGSGSARMSVPV